VLTRQSILDQREPILEIARRHGATKTWLIGSVARDEADEKSDVDFLVRLGPDCSIYDQGGIALDLMDMLGVHVDVVSEGALRGRFGRKIRREAVPLEE
jgi:predicted nucleotidyltransferase